MLSVTLDKLIIPTYPEPGKEEMPMFAENRVHQRTSGNPYPNRIVLKVEREKKTEKEYKVIGLENDYLKLEILPEIGGRIYSSYDKTTGYDFFGGFDHGKKCGVVHIADHHISPGKKMFTWAYNQLSESWENALTDSDGAYAELMAGVYSDNQSDLSWIEPYETKVFSQSWFPNGDLGVPCFANLNLAVHWEEGTLLIQATKNMEAEITVTDGEKTVFKKKCALLAGKPFEFSDVPKKEGSKLSVKANGKTVAEYENKAKELYNIPDTTEDMPYFKEVKTAEELYLEGVHVMQYRDPTVKGDSY